MTWLRRSPNNGQEGSAFTSTWFERARPYKRKRRLLTPSEAIMLEKLRLVFSRSEFEVFANVRLADVIHIDLPRWQSKRIVLELNDIARMHLDFVICKKTSTEIIAVIELDDPSHDNEKAQHRDQRKDKALGAAGVRLYRFRAEDNDSYQQLRDVILAQALDAGGPDTSVVEKIVSLSSRAINKDVIRTLDSGKTQEPEIQEDQDIAGRESKQADWNLDAWPGWTSNPYQDRRKTREGMGRMTKFLVSVLGLVLLATFLNYMAGNVIGGAILHMAKTVRDLATHRTIVATKPEQHRNSAASNLNSVRRVVQEPEGAGMTQGGPQVLTVKPFEEEAAWDRWYKRPDYCDAGGEQAIKACANDYIRKKREFAQLVAAGKIH